MAVVNAQIMDPAGATRKLQVLNDNVARDAVDAIYRAVVRFLQFKQIAQTPDEKLVRFDLLRRKAGSRMQRGGFVSRDLRFYLVRSDCFPSPVC